MDEAKEECGICAVYLKGADRGTTETPLVIINTLLQLQHRGQKSAGYAVYNPIKPEEARRKEIVLYKGVGRVAEVFHLNQPPEYQTILKRGSGIAGIGHTRYSTSGQGRNDDFYASFDEAQPFLRRHPRVWKKFAIAFNGNIVNYDTLAKDMMDEGISLETEVDTEVLMNLMSLGLRQSEGSNIKHTPQKPNLFGVTQELMEKLDGAYNVVTLFGDGDLLVFRDPQGFHPLVWGENKYMYAVASESTALEKIKISKFWDVKPGEAMIFNREGFKHEQVKESRKKSYCHFEWVYFSKASSKNEGRGVNSVRRELGEELAEIEPLRGKLDEQYIVVPAPKTAITAAQSYARKLKLPISYAIDKIDGDRGFINGPLERARIMTSNYTVQVDEVKGKKLIILDDSIVRGETLRQLIRQLKRAGAKEVHVRLTEPPIQHPCFYAIDYPSRKKLIASPLHTQKEETGQRVLTLEDRIAKEVGATSVVFQKREGLIRAIGFPAEDLCLACLSGQYPTPKGQEYADLDLRNLEEKLKTTSRVVKP